MIRSIEGDLSGDGIHLGIASARWNQTITDKLLGAALRRAEELGVTEVTVIHVPGALELAVAAKQLASAGCDAVVAIGVVIKGETDHYELVSTESARGVSQVAVETSTPVANAILAVHDVSQAIDRAGPDGANKGVEAVEAAIATANALRNLESG